MTTNSLMVLAAGVTALLGGIVLITAFRRQQEAKGMLAAASTLFFLDGVLLLRSCHFPEEQKHPKPIGMVTELVVQSRKSAPARPPAPEKKATSSKSPVPAKAPVPELSPAKAKAPEHAPPRPAPQPAPTARMEDNKPSPPRETKLVQPRNMSLQAGTGKAETTSSKMSAVRPSPVLRGSAKEPLPAPKSERVQELRVASPQPNKSPAKSLTPTTVPQKKIEARLFAKLEERSRTRVQDADGTLSDYTISLDWDNFNDVDLHVITADGEEIYFGHAISACGAMLDVDKNVVPETNEPVENIYWPEGTRPTGPVKIYVVLYRQHDRPGCAGPTPFVVCVRVQGEVRLFTGVVDTNDKKGVFVAEIPIPEEPDGSMAKAK